MNNFNVQGLGMGSGGPGAFPQARGNNLSIVSVIHAKIQQQGPHTGWQTQLTRDTRVGAVMTMSV